ncbi:MAG: dTDP-4-keto-6-deoxy-D-glucose epimerase [Blastochloris sp.]|nr:dTDP-4-keto-6-deoxy-D-glucose epimerase [Blastochloris sp.]
MNIRPTRLKGLFYGLLNRLEDDRGDFVKSYHEHLLREHGIEFTLREEFYSTSRKGVLRGMHFQKPPMDHFKIVICLAGSVHDVVIDLRIGSPTYGQAEGFHLSAVIPALLFIPPGFAHGFLALEEGSLMHYKTSEVHSPEHDSGIKWNSFGYDWGVHDVMLSNRDKALPGLGDFKSPFRMEASF